MYCVLCKCNIQTAQTVAISLSHTNVDPGTWDSDTNSQMSVHENVRCTRNNDIENQTSVYENALKEKLQLSYTHQSHAWSFSCML